MQKHNWFSLRTTLTDAEQIGPILKSKALVLLAMTFVLFLCADCFAQIRTWGEDLKVNGVFSNFDSDGNVVVLTILANNKRKVRKLSLSQLSRDDLEWIVQKKAIKSSFNKTEPTLNSKLANHLPLVLIEDELAQLSKSCTPDATSARIENELKKLEDELKEKLKSAAIAFPIADVGFTSRKNCYLDLVPTYTANDGWSFQVRGNAGERRLTRIWPTSSYKSPKIDKASGKRFSGITLYSRGLENLGDLAKAQTGQAVLIQSDMSVALSLFDTTNNRKIRALPSSFKGKNKPGRQEIYRTSFFVNESFVLNVKLFISTAHTLSICESMA